MGELCSVRVAALATSIPSRGAARFLRLGSAARRRQGASSPTRSVTAARSAYASTSDPRAPRQDRSQRFRQRQHGQKDGATASCGPLPSGRSLPAADDVPCGVPADADRAMPAPSESARWSLQQAGANAARSETGRETERPRPRQNATPWHDGPHASSPRTKTCRVYGAASRIAVGPSDCADEYRPTAPSAATDAGTLEQSLQRVEAMHSRLPRSSSHGRGSQAGRPVANPLSAERRRVDSAETPTLAGGCPFAHRVDT